MLVKRPQFGAVRVLLNLRGRLRAEFNEDEARDDNGKWTKGGEEGPKSKSEIAKASYSATNLVEQRLADEMEKLLSKALGIPRTGNNAPFDLQHTGIGIEVKTFISNKSGKITMHKDAIKRKRSAARKLKLKMFTVVVDRRGGATTYYWSRGVGSFRVSTMKPAATVKLLRGALGL